MGYRLAVGFIATIGLATISVSYVVYRRRQKSRGKKLSNNPKWKQVGTVKEISMYPLQSGTPLIIPNAKCDSFGISIRGLRDRCLVLLNAQDEAAFSGTYPSMLAISTEIEDECSLVVRAPGKEPLSLNLSRIAEGKPIKEKQRNGFTMRLIECDEIHHEWFSIVILQRTRGLKLFIVLEPNIQPDIWGDDKSDFNPIMVMNNKSVSDLNQRLVLTPKVHHLQFRGNLLLECNDNVKPYDEDNWSWLKIGDTAKACVLQYRGPCLRCISPNVDIKTCKHSPHFEPLKTLKSYRLVHNSKEPTMGAYYNINREGFIKHNDPVYAIVASK
ncbi:mitochondrial amidoxime reducing component 2 [Stomoxys calcitrans]|uniref:mitochondrial amidoxime reducing component 2 n=1 Tax=Stomoxys calcitrans TaxID=35570 RepID=UPI0027E386F2|nr:mitochondrial amidoxime reducing component 2 [Stomoxys calcitrans]